MGNFFQFVVFTFLENALNLNFFVFTQASVLQSKLQVEYFENLFPFPKTKWVEETMICLIKIQSGNVKMTWNISLFMFCMICNFSKFDDFTVLWIISIKLCGIKLIASSLQPW